MMDVSLIVSTLSLSFAAVNLVLLLSLLSSVTSVAEAPKAWNLMTLGLSLVVVRFAIDVFVMVNTYLQFTGIRLIAAVTSIFGFGFLFAGIYRVWEVVYS
ncbi:MAG: hypothetical protein SVQ76_00670 [Candidatus Nanohaloarchaea archaeon]|nr:hypothetical protein [Candidatus Nanohaloarchaea archaeon]